MTKQVRVYPTCCTSAFCGLGPESCPPCRNYPKLQEFKRWVKATGAIVDDPIWCPTVYVAQREDESV